MSYLVLARKWRPQNFDEVVGQQSVVRTLKNALARNRVAHAMLFSGVRGVGKTTLARIMAKALNCGGETSSPPCNECESCREITNGVALDLHEIDGASNRGIQEIRELKENIRFMPTKGSYKIIIIDEVHMLTAEAFNALLKTLEEPPAHVIFMFATTELHKVPVTILSRCQRYELKRVPFVELFDFFKKIAARENVSISDEALEMIVREAEGSVRDGLSLLDQIFSFAGESLTDVDVRQVLGIVDRQVFENLAAALLDADLAEALAILDQSYGSGVDLKRFVHDLVNYFRSLMICRTTRQPERILDVSDRELENLKKIAAVHHEQKLYSYLNILLDGVRELRYSTHPRLSLEMVFVKAVEGGSVLPIGQLIEKVDELIRNAGPLESAVPVQPIQQPQPPEPVQKSAEQAAAVGTREEDAQFRSEPAAPSIASDKKKGPAPKVAEPDDSLSDAEALDAPTKDVRRDWDDFVLYVKERKAWMAHVIQLSSSIREKNGYLVIKFDDRSDCAVLHEKENHRALTVYAQDFFQKEFKIQVTAPGDSGDENEAGDEDDPRRERRALANDPLVQMATEVFNGQVAGIRTGPRFREAQQTEDVAANGK